MCRRDVSRWELTGSVGSARRIMLSQGIGVSPRKCKCPGATSMMKRLCACFARAGLSSMRESAWPERRNQKRKRTSPTAKCPILPLLVSAWSANMATTPIWASVPRCHPSVPTTTSRQEHALTASMDSIFKMAPASTSTATSNQENQRAVLPATMATPSTLMVYVSTQMRTVWTYLVVDVSNVRKAFMWTSREDVSAFHPSAPSLTSRPANAWNAYQGISWIEWGNASRR